MNDLGVLNLIMESTILTSLPGRLSSPPQNAEKNSAAAALVNFGGCGGAPYFFRRRRREHVSGWRGGGIRRLTGLRTKNITAVSVVTIAIVLDIRSATDDRSSRSDFSMQQ
jgi:hypothetical protein